MRPGAFKLRGIMPTSTVSVRRPAAPDECLHHKQRRSFGGRFYKVGFVATKGALRVALRDGYTEAKINDQWVPIATLVVKKCPRARPHCGGTSVP